jgi:hypothetical protein
MFTSFIAGLRRMKKQKSEGVMSSSNNISPEPFETVAIFDLEAFKVRMVHIRETYESIIAGTQVDFTKAENDPWRVVEPWQLLPLIQEHNPTSALLDKNVEEHSEEDKEKLMKLVSVIPLDQLPQFSGLRDSHQQELDFYKRELEKNTRDLQRIQREREQLEQDRQRNESDRVAQREERMTWENTDRAKDAKLNEQAVRMRDLERQLERQRQEAAEARDQLRLALSVDPALRSASSPGFAAYNAPAEVRLKHASEESAVAAHLASKLLGSLRDIKGDLKNQMAQKELLRSDTSSGGTRAGNFYQSRAKKG